ncbi:MAG: TonB-dependent receptor [Bacteroidetes bacterium]|nr:TonB-dependent receptor [Bacteroidota bacterium]
MKHFFVVFLLINSFLHQGLIAQNYTQVIRGKITDKDTRQPLPGATVVLMNSNPLVGTTADLSGKFRLDQVPVGRQSLKVIYMGYEDAIIPDVMVGTGKEIVLSVELEEKVIKMKEVVISANPESDKPLNTMAFISARSLNIAEANRYAGGFGDPSRMSASFAGVATADDENNEIVIRGNSPRGMLWRLEGIEIPNPNHFPDGEGASGGGISILSNDVLANSDFFTGAFPAEYGNATSGVYDIRMRKGNSEKREYVCQLGVLGLEAALEGPFRKGGQATYLVHYRYSTFTLLDKFGINPGDNEVIPTFQDLACHFNFPTRHTGTFSFFGVTGNSSAGQRAPKDSSLWKYRDDHFEETENHSVATYGLSHIYLLNDNKSWLRTVLAFTSQDNRVDQDSLNNEYHQVTIHNESFNHSACRSSCVLNHKFNASHQLRAGLIYYHLMFSLSDKGIDWDNEKQWRVFIAQKGSTDQVESFLQWKYKMNDRLSLTSGLHYLVLALNGNFSVEPRIGLSWTVAPNNTLSLGAGLHSRVETISNYLVEVTNLDGTTSIPNKNLNFTRAAHIVAGYEHNFPADIHCKTEVYYQYLYDVPVERDSISPLSAINANEGIATMPLVNKGIGYNYGVELTLEKMFSKSFYFLVTASVFDSRYQGSDHVWRNTVFNSKYIINVLAGKEFRTGKKKNNILGFNLKTNLRGGYRTTPIDFKRSIEKNETVYFTEKTFEEKAPDYFRIDLGVKFKKNLPSWSWTISLDIQNLTNRQNIAAQYYDNTSHEIREKYLAGMVPLLSYRVEF